MSTLRLAPPPPVAVGAAGQDVPPSSAPQALPAPSADPLRIDRASDPILMIARSAASLLQFNKVIQGAVTRNPALGETVAQADEAVGARNEARARQYPSMSFSFSYFNVVSRAFSDDPLNILERSRPRSRTDGTAEVTQPLLDFGATGSRIRAADSRIDAAVAGIDDTASQVALRAVAAWYNVFGYRALVALSTQFVADQRSLGRQLDERIAQGYSAPGDTAQVASAIAATQAQLADYRRSLANAEAQYEQLVGAPPPPVLSRAPVPPMNASTVAAVREAVQTLPTVRAARAQAQAAAQDRRAVKADRLPVVGAALDAGRYGVFETARDYDVRASATVTLRLFGGAQQRVEQADARARGAAAHLDRTREEAQRDAAIALSDVQALGEAQAAIADDYLASRQSRDVLAERFRVSRGTLFDLMNANTNYFGVAARYIQALTELDTSRYVLLARTGKLLDTLEIQPARIAR